MTFDNQKNFDRILKSLEKYGFVDTTWSNDAMPSISLLDHNGEAIMTVWVDWLDPDKSEFAEDRLDGSYRTYYVSHGMGAILETDSVFALVHFVLSYVTVHNIDEAKGWLCGLKEAGKLWHMDDEPTDCLRDHNLDNKELSRLKMNQLAVLKLEDWGQYDDVHGYCLELLR